MVIDVLHEHGPSDAELAVPKVGQATIEVEGVAGLVAPPRERLLPRVPDGRWGLLDAAGVEAEPPGA